MNYINLYNKLINTRKSLERKKGKGIYFESHHIIPKWLGGSDKKCNRILLTAKEHFIAHLLLWKHYRDRSSALAFHMMTKSSNSKQERCFNASKFEKARIAFVETQLGDKNWSRNNPNPNKGKPSPNKGKKLASRDWMCGDNNPAKLESTRLKISQALKGKIRSSEHIEKLNESFRMSEKITCQHCFKEVDYRNFGRWHGDKCKHKINGEIV